MWTWYKIKKKLNNIMRTNIYYAGLDWSKKVLEMGNVSLFSSGNEIYIDEASVV